AIGLSKARRAGVDLPAPKKGTASAATRKKAERDLERGRSGNTAKPSRKRSQAREKALKREPRSAASHAALSNQAKKAAAARKRPGPVNPTTRNKSSTGKPGKGGPDARY